MLWKPSTIFKGESLRMYLRSLIVWALIGAEITVVKFTVNLMTKPDETVSNISQKNIKIDYDNPETKVPQISNIASQKNSCKFINVSSDLHQAGHCINAKGLPIFKSFCKELHIYIGNSRNIFYATNIRLHYLQTSKSCCPWSNGLQPKQLWDIKLFMTKHT